MVQYKGILKKRTNERKIMLVIIGGIILFLSYPQRKLLYIIMALVMISAIFYDKDHIVDEKGVHIIYKFFGVFKVPYSWSWDMITAMRPDYKKAAPNIYMEIAKDVTIRAFVFTKSDAIGVMELAKRMNPDMYVDDRDEEQRQKDSEEHKAKMAFARERARAEKKARKKK